MSMEKAQGNSTFLFPPGVRFHPSDEELIVYYLLNKLNSRPLPAAVVGEIELYNHNPWELPKKALFGEDEWYFFSPRERKYPNGARPNRSAASGYWKATGTDKVITSCTSGSRIGVKKALVFYVGKPPNGIKTDWIMIEYRIPDTLIRPQKSKGSMRLDHWVLCRIRQKGNMSKNIWDNSENQNKATAAAGDIPNMNDMPPVTTNPLSDVYLQSRDCQLLAKLAVTTTQDSTDQVASSHHSGNIGKLYTAAYEQDSNVDNPGATDTSYFEGYYLNQQQGQQERASNNDNGYGYGNGNGNGNGNFSPYTRGMPNLNNNENNDVAGYSMQPPPSNTSYYNPHESRDMFTLNLSGAMTDLQQQGLDVSPFGERFQQ